MEEPRAPWSHLKKTFKQDSIQVSASLKAKEALLGDTKDLPHNEPSRSGKFARRVASMVNMETKKDIDTSPRLRSRRVSDTVRMAQQVHLVSKRVKQRRSTVTSQERPQSAGSRRASDGEGVLETSLPRRPSTAALGGRRLSNLSNKVKLLQKSGSAFGGVGSSASVVTTDSEATPVNNKIMRKLSTATMDSTGSANVPRPPSTKSAAPTDVVFMSARAAAKFKNAKAHHLEPVLLIPKPPEKKVRQKKSWKDIVMNKIIKPRRFQRLVASGKEQKEQNEMKKLLVQAGLGKPDEDDVEEMHGKMIRVFTWGKGNSGCLGRGNYSDSEQPEIVYALVAELPLAISCGFEHTALITVKGQLYTWGYGGKGVLGHGNEENVLKPAVVKALQNEVVVNVSCGGGHTAAIVENGTLYTWGWGWKGALGLGNEENAFQPSPISFPGGVSCTLVSCGTNHTVAITSNGVYSWGRNQYGELGLGSLVPLGQHSCKPRRISRFDTERIVLVDSGWGFSGALTEDGKLLTWGRNTHGQLGLGNTDNQSTPITVTMLKHHGGPCMLFSCGSMHMGALTKDKSIVTWGSCEHGQLGNSLQTKKKKYVEFPGKVEFIAEKGIVSVQCGWSHTAVITAFGTIITWGNGQHMQLAHEMHSSQPFQNPDSIKSLSDSGFLAKLVSCGGMHMAAVCENVAGT